MNPLLIVDDEPAMLKMLKWRLETKGYNVLTAISGDQALDIVKQNTIDLIITDVRMPVMDGLTLVKKIKSQVQQDIPCIVMSGHGDIDMNTQAKEVGACGFIHKPVKFDDLEQLIQQTLGHLAPDFTQTR